MVGDAPNHVLKILPGNSANIERLRSLCPQREATKAMRIQNSKKCGGQASPAALVCVLFALVLLPAAGCLPEAPPLDGPLDFDEANGELFEMHHNHGARYTGEYKLDGKPFKANWELANLLHKRAKVQVKPPTETFSEVDLYRALEIALADEEMIAWHQVATDTIMQCFRQALLNEDSDIASRMCPDAPYDITVKVKNNVSEWFCEVKVQILLDPKKVEEGRKYAQKKLDDLEERHAND